jgi:hypothetical protein
MFYLGYDFIASSLIWLFGLAIFIFTFRHQIARLFYKQTGFALFISKLKIFLEKTYPKIKFDFDIIQSSKKEPNPLTRKYIIADNILNQYKKLPLDKTRFPKGTPSNLHWSSYVFNSEPNKNKLPPDWPKRKNALFVRDNKQCFRCSKYIDINTMEVYMIRPVSQGGKYYLENLLPLCKDCHKVLTLKSDDKKLDSLFIKDKLYDIVQNS